MNTCCVVFVSEHKLWNVTLSLIVFQDLLVDCFKPTEVSDLLPSHTLFSFARFWTPSPPSCIMSLLSPCRTSSQSCSTRSGGCRSSPRLRRNDGVLLPRSPCTPPPPPSHFVFLPLPVLLFYSLLSSTQIIMKYTNWTLFPPVVRPSVLTFLSSHLLLPGFSLTNHVFLLFDHPLFIGLSF